MSDRLIRIISHYVTKREKITKNREKLSKKIAQKCFN